MQRFPDLGGKTTTTTTITVARGTNGVYGQPMVQPIVHHACGQSGPISVNNSPLLTVSLAANEIGQTPSG